MQLLLQLATDTSTSQSLENRAVIGVHLICTWCVRKKCIAYTGVVLISAKNSPHPEAKTQFTKVRNYFRGQGGNGVLMSGIPMEAFSVSSTITSLPCQFWERPLI